MMKQNFDEAELTEIALFKHKNECACYSTVFFFCIECNCLNNLHWDQHWFLYMIMFIRQKILNYTKWV